MMATWVDFGFSRGRFVVFALLVLVFSCSCGGVADPSSTAFTHEVPRQSVALHDVLELSFRHGATYPNPFLNATLETDFIAPSGRVLPRKGFYHSGQTWAVRFRPDEDEKWRYRYRFYTLGKLVHAGEGEFRTIPGNPRSSIRVDATNPFRWTFSNGRPYFPLGLQDCVDSRDGRVGTFTVDGEGRDDNSGRRLTADQYFDLYGNAGFNLYRFSQRNCSYPIHDDLDHYNVANSLATDELLQTATAHGFRILFGFFGFHGDWNAGNVTERALRFARVKLGYIDESISDATYMRIVEREKRFIEYCVARWGVYTDFWQLLNERKATDEWIRQMSAHVQQVDPDRKPVAISWEKPDLPEIAINTPHWYESEPESESDSRVQAMGTKWKAFGKPVLVGEQGNSGMNWDPTSATRMRVRAWTALFQEIGLIFWNTSWSKWGMNQGRYTLGRAANIYLGPEERTYTRALQQFSSRLDKDVRIVAAEVSSPQSARAYGLRSPSLTAVYVHHFANHDSLLKGLEINVDLPSAKGLRYEWINPATGSVLEKGALPAGSAIKVPGFSIDTALLVYPNQPRVSH
jgi:hypothetical protein